MNAQDLALLDGLRIASGVRPRADSHGVRQSRSVGGCAEFVDYRPYARGDDLRSVDWNVAARTDRLYLKQRVREAGLPVWLLLDASRSMTVGRPAPYDFAKEIAYGFAYIALRRSDAILVSSFGDAVGTAVRATGVNSLPLARDALQRMAPEPRTDISRALRSVVARSNRVGAIIIISDLLDPSGFQDGIRAAVARGFDVSVVHTLAPDMETPELDADARLTDIETGESREALWNADALFTYTKRVRDFVENAEAVCRSFGVRYARVRSDMSLGDAFHKAFREARMVSA